jgi:hypothetical protein
MYVRADSRACRRIAHAEELREPDNYACRTITLPAPGFRLPQDQSKHRVQRKSFRHRGKYCTKEGFRKNPANFAGMVSNALAARQRSALLGVRIME